VKYKKITLLWIIGALIFIIALLTLFSHNFPAFILLLLISLLITPFTGKLISSAIALAKPGVFKSQMIIFLLLILIALICFQQYSHQSIFKSGSGKIELIDIYDNQLHHWYTSYNSIYINTSFGDVHLVVSGDPQNPPAILLPASNLAAWSYIYNIVNLNNSFHTFVIDPIGEAGKSKLADINKFPVTDQQIRQHYNEILDSLGIDNAVFIAASGNGHLALRFAQTEPDRVKKLVLIAPQGFSLPLKNITSNALANIFPTAAFNDYTCNIVIGQSPIVRSLCYNWLCTAMQVTTPKSIPSRLFTPSELQAVKTPVLIILGSNDQIIGSPKKIIPLAANLADVKIETLNSGHLVYIEKSGEVNKIINSFLLD
jgi:pimeloyl-ACP methyl ester carboxylesterase